MKSIRQQIIEAKQEKTEREENEEDLSDSQGESDTAIPDETGEPEET